MSVASGKEKYRRKTAAGGPGEAKFQASKGVAASHWVQSLTAAGIPPGPLSQAAYQSGMSAAQYRGGDPDKWERNLRDALSR